MNRQLAIFAIVTVTLLSAGLTLKSQAPAPSPAQPVSTVELLTKMKADNDKLLSRQQATLEQIKALSTEAQQIKTFSRRG